jgi:acetoin utilization deacetylase AcuC-like enzyme
MHTGLVWHDDFAKYDSGMLGVLEQPHPLFEPLPTIDTPLPKRRMKSLLDACGMTSKLTPITPRMAKRSELLRAHQSDYLDRLAEMSAGKGGNGGDGAPFGPGDFDIAQLSAGGCLAAVDEVMSGRVRNAYALVHPPGHHARPSVGTGFCLLANGPLAALHAKEVWGVDKVAIVDWDVHHGNSAQEIFWTDPSVLAISLHQADCFPPASGNVGEIGGGAGENYTINIPLPPGSGEPAYRASMEQVVLPALRAFRPGLILVASGFDAGFFDPLGRMCLTSSSFAWMMAAIVGVADDLCGGRVVVTQEGGYDPSSVPFHGLATIEALSGQAAGIDNPFAIGPVVAEIRVHEVAAVVEAAQIFKRIQAQWGDHDA